jgi:hypothetical protein
MLWLPLHGCAACMRACTRLVSALTELVRVREVATTSPTNRVRALLAHTAAQHVYRNVIQWLLAQFHLSTLLTKQKLYVRTVTRASVDRTVDLQ